VVAVCIVVRKTAAARAGDQLVFVVRTRVPTTWRAISVGVLVCDAAAARPRHELFRITGTLVQRIWASVAILIGLGAAARIVVVAPRRRIVVPIRHGE
jgi:hypothetical protein